jgi:hypothetical protein
VRHPESKIFSFLVMTTALAGVASLLSVSAAIAREATTQENVAAPCAIVENYRGDLEILDPSRTHSIAVSKNTGIPCGGWVSSDAGWAIIHHRDGHEFRIGPHTFIEIPENNATSPDQVVLYHGEMFGSTEGGGGDLRIITANARARLPKGNLLINYDQENQDTQMIALDAPATLENRFEPSKKILVQAGESTSLNFKELRVVPTFAKAVSIAALKEKLSLFHVSEREAAEAYEIAQARAERRLAASLTPEQEADAAAKEAAKNHNDDLNSAGDDLQFKKTEKRVGSRKLASTSKKGESRTGSSSYLRHPINPDEAAVLKTHWARRMTGGEDVGESILFPEKSHGKPRQVKVLIEDPAAQMDARKKRTEDAEKRRLIEELSQIHED